MFGGNGNFKILLKMFLNWKVSFPGIQSATLFDQRHSFPGSNSTGNVLPKKESTSEEVPEDPRRSRPPCSSPYFSAQALQETNDYSVQQSKKAPSFLKSSTEHTALNARSSWEGLTVCFMHQRRKRFMILMLIHDGTFSPWQSQNVSISLCMLD